MSALVVLDDRRARLRAGRAGLKITGTLGVLSEIHRYGLAARDLHADLTALEEGGMRLSPALRDAVLRGGGEDPDD